MQLSKKGSVGNIQNQTLGVVLGIVSVVILVSIAPELYTVLSTALDNISGENIPFVSGLTGIIGLIFGVVIFLGALYGMFKMFQNKR